MAMSDLLEFDQRFSVLAPKLFVPYDINEPDDFPDSLKCSVDIAVVDPPYLNEVCIANQPFNYI